MMTASRSVSCFSPRAWVATRSASHITALQAIRATPTTHRERSGPVMTSLARKPTTPTGMRADDDVPAHPVVAVAAPLGVEEAPHPRRGDPPDVAGEVDDDRRDRAHLDDGGVRRHGGVVHVEAENLLGDGEVTGAGDRAGTP